MKTFSDLLDTPRDLPVHLALQPITDNGAPLITIWVNGNRLYQDWMIGPWSIDHTVDLSMPLEIRIDLREKHYSSERETAVVIHGLTVDEFDVLPWLTKQATYDHDHWCQDVSNYLGFNGEWCWRTHEPFYIWQHRTCNMGWLLQPVKP